MQWVKAMQKHIVRSKLSTNDGRACSERERVKRINECKIAESGIINYVQGDTKIILDKNMSIDGYTKRVFSERDENGFS